MDAGTVVAFFAVGFAIVTAVLAIKARRVARQETERFAAIDGLVFSEGFRRKFTRLHPHLDSAQRLLIEAGLRNWFRCCAQSGLARLAMPSRAVDAAWHGFILFTAEYRFFCQQAFGRYLDHVPAEASPDLERDLAPWHRVWQAACAIERIDPQKPSRLPTLFAMDSAVAWPDGSVWRSDCRSGDGDPRPCIAPLLRAAPTAGGVAGGCGGGGASSAVAADVPRDGAHHGGGGGQDGGGGHDGGGGSDGGGGGSGCGGGGGCGSS